jgi:hypothetical protein
MPFVVDVVLVIVFCLIGRRSHHEGVISAGLFRTLWPFGVGLLLGWALAPIVARGDNGKLWPTGVTIWLCTLIGGMVLRVISGQGIAISFICVAAAVLALFLLGWRAAWRALT